MWPWSENLSAWVLMRILFWWKKKSGPSGFEAPKGCVLYGVSGVVGKTVIVIWELGTITCSISTRDPQHRRKGYEVVTKTDWPLIFSASHFDAEVQAYLYSKTTAVEAEVGDVEQSLSHSFARFKLVLEIMADSRFQWCSHPKHSPNQIYCSRDVANKKLMHFLLKLPNP